MKFSSSGFCAGDGTLGTSDLLSTHEAQLFLSAFGRFVSCFSLFVFSARPGHIGGTPSGCSRWGPPGLRWPHGLDF